MGGFDVCIVNGKHSYLIAKFFISLLNVFGSCRLICNAKAVFEQILPHEKHWIYPIIDLKAVHSTFINLELELYFS